MRSSSFVGKDPSQQANEWAKQKAAQIERAKILREQRKQEMNIRQSEKMQVIDHKQHQQELKRQAELEAQMKQQQEPEVEIPEFLRGYKEDNTYMQKKSKGEWISQTNNAQSNYSHYNKSNLLNRNDANIQQNSYSKPNILGSKASFSNNYDPSPIMKQNNYYEKNETEDQFYKKTNPQALKRPPLNNKARPPSGQYQIQTRQSTQQSQYQNNQQPTSSSISNNYRKVFKPELGISKQNNVARNNSFIDEQKVTPTLSQSNKRGIRDSFSKNDADSRTISTQGASFLSINNQNNKQITKPFQTSQTKLLKQNPESQYQIKSGVQRGFIDIGNNDFNTTKLSQKSSSNIVSHSPQIPLKLKQQQMKLKNNKKPAQNQYNYQDEYPKQNQSIKQVNKQQSKFNVYEDVTGGQDSLNRCPDCGRTFNDVAYEKHVRICKKVFFQKRKEFNSQAKRIVAPEQRQFIRQLKVQEKQQEQQKARQPQGMSKWKLQSMQFRMAMKAGRQNNADNFEYSTAKPSFSGLQKKPQQQNRGGQRQQQASQYTAQELAQLQAFEAASDTRVPCRHCGRKFNEIAAERHIPVCANRMKQQQLKQFKR